MADRIGKRDAGNKPAIGDRIPFVYIPSKNKKAFDVGEDEALGVPSASGIAKEETLQQSGLGIAIAEVQNSTNYLD